jgi:DNA-binding SARP family transcriptional activator
LLRVYLAGEVMIEAGARLVREARLPARQGRLAFVHLVDRRAHPVPREELADAVWPESLPRAWDVALSAIVSKLRLVMGAAGIPRDEAISAAFGCYQLHLPAGAWVDLEVATAGVHQAESLVAQGRQAEAYGDALVAVTILRRPYLPGATGPWVEGRREALRGLLVRALECMITCLSANREWPLAVRNAEELVALEPFRESGYRQLMRLHVARGDRAEALRVYELCRQRLRDELGVGPSAETEALQVSLLKAG